MYYNNDGHRVILPQICYNNSWDDVKSAWPYGLGHTRATITVWDDVKSSWPYGLGHIRATITVGIWSYNHTRATIAVGMNMSSSHSLIGWATYVLQ